MSHLMTVDVWGDDSLWLYANPLLDHRAYEEWKSAAMGLDGRIWRNLASRGHGGFQCPANQASLDYITQTWKPGQYVIAPKAKALLDGKHLARYADTTRRDSRWSYLFEGKPCDFTYPTLRVPFQQQAVAVEAMLGREYFALLMEMGTGKTKAAIDEHFQDMLATVGDNAVDKTLIVLPRSLKVNWKREYLANVPDFMPLDIEIVEGGAKEIAKTLAALDRRQLSHRVAIISYDALRTALKVILDWAPNRLILDESHYVKNHTSQRWKACKAVATLPSCRRRRILTGTPVSNTVLDLWAQYELLAPGLLGWQIFEQFKRRYCDVISMIDPITKRPTPFDKVVGHRHLEELKERISRCSFIVRKEHCLKFLPPKLYETRRVPMPPEMRRLYTDLRDKFCAELDATKEVKTEFMFQQMIRLSQICAGFVVAETKIDLSTPGPVEDVEPEVTPIPGADAKLNEMIEDAVEVCRTGKLLIWARFNYDCDAIVNALKAHGIGVVLYDGRETRETVRQQCIDDFNNDPIVRVFVSKVGSGGVGLTLLGDQTTEGNACRASFFYSNTWSYGQRAQAEDRVHRIGQHNPVLYRDYVYEHSIEETITAALLAKRDLASEMKNISTIKEILLGENDEAY